MNRPRVQRHIGKDNRSNDSKIVLCHAHFRVQTRARPQ
ncbi:hypothetical protein OKW46_007012 [Paraburkholderia sp. WSM4179]|nr:hypothetical protein [Paraburkholderia sp. WSM4179]